MKGEVNSLGGSYSYVSQISGPYTGGVDHRSARDFQPLAFDSLRPHSAHPTVAVAENLGCRHSVGGNRVVFQRCGADDRQHQSGVIGLAVVVLVAPHHLIGIQGWESSQHLLLAQPAMELPDERPSAQVIGPKSSADGPGEPAAQLSAAAE